MGGNLTIGLLSGIKNGFATVWGLDPRGTGRCPDREQYEYRYIRRATKAEIELFDMWQVGHVGDEFFCLYFTQIESIRRPLNG